MKIQKTKDNHIIILKGGNILRLTAAEAFEALAWLYEQRTELYQAVQHPEQRGGVRLKDTTQEDDEAYSDKLAANSIGLEARDEIVDWMMSRKDDDPERLASEVASARREYQAILKESVQAMNTTDEPSFTERLEKPWLPVQPGEEI